MEAQARSLLREIEDARVERPWMYGYQKLRIQALLDFHASFAKIRLVSANNRGGKTTRGAWELVCFATGYHPIRKERYPTPNICWAVSLDNKNYGHIIEERLKEWLPPGTEWREAKRYFQLPTKYGGSRIYLKSADGGDTKFAAEGVLAAWFDEGREVMHKPFMETLARLKPGWPLRLYITMSPEDGAGGWTWAKFYNAESKERFKDAEIFYYTMEECLEKNGGHLPNETLDDFKAQFPEWMWPAKIYGRPGIMSSNPYFRIDQIARTEERCDTPRYGRLVVDSLGTVTFKEGGAGDIVILRPPVPGRRYIMPTDVGGGVNRDYTVAAILDVEDKAEVAYFKSRSLGVEEATVARIMPLGRFYNRARSIPESNGEHGQQHLTILRERKYRPIYVQKKWSQRKRDYHSVFGWRTDERGSRNSVYDAWAAVLWNNEWTVSRDALQEARYVSEMEGRPDHPQGMNDDHFFALGVGFAALTLQPTMTRKPVASEIPTWSGEMQYAI